MVGTIAPLVQEAEERGQVARARSLPVGYVAVTVAGTLVLGSAMLGLRLALAAWAPAAAGWLVTWGPAVVGAVAVYLLTAAVTGVLPLPMVDRQVPLAWRVQWGATKASMAYAFVLGIAVLTRINAPGFYLVPLTLLVAPNPTLGFAVVVAFGLAKGGGVAVRSVTQRQRQLDDPELVARLAVARRHGLVTAQLMALAALVVAGAGVSGMVAL